MDWLECKPDVCNVYLILQGYLVGNGCTDTEVDGAFIQIRVDYFFNHITDENRPTVKTLDC
eukprot:1155337-Pelagomonas_calceolata.AAC.2